MPDGGGVAGVVGVLSVGTQVVEPFDVYEGRELDVGKGLPRPALWGELPRAWTVH